MRQKKTVRMIRGIILKKHSNVSDNIKKESKKEATKIRDSERE